MRRFVHPRAPLGLFLLLASHITLTARANAASYFSALPADEKEEYTAWLEEHTSSYPRHTFMPSSSGDAGDGAAIFWNIDEESERIKFALAVRADNGWAGFGISEAGGMRGADMALYQASRPTELVDAHVIDDRSAPLTDDCQDWTLEGTPVNEGGWMIVEFSRLLDTKDGQDHAIKNDVELNHAPARIIAAWGDGDDVSYHGEKKARGSIRLYANLSEDGLTESQVLLNTLEAESDGYFEIAEDEFEIPASETYYHDVCKTFDELNLELPEGQGGATMIGGIPLISEETRQYVHHFLVYQGKDCSREAMFRRSMIYLWVPGYDGLALPEDVGFPMFHDANNQAVMIQIHYNNPSLDIGKKDSSGVRFYYSHEERTHQAGMLQTGDPLLGLLGDGINDGLTKYSFTCPGACSSFFLGKEARDGEGSQQGVTILSEFLHMHKTGVRMTNEVIRGNDVFHKAASDVYDFDQQGGYQVPQDTYEVLPGDSFRTTCYYKDGHAFGMSSQEEMCIAFMMYYPKMEHPTYGTEWLCPHAPWFDFGTGCETNLDIAMLSSDEDLGRKFGISSGECAVEPSTGDNLFEPVAADPTDFQTDVDADPTDLETDVAAEPTDLHTENGQTTDEDPITIAIPAPAPEGNPTTVSGAGWIGLSSLLPFALLPLLVFFI